MSQKSNRIEWIDIAKGISIILVVLGHTRISSIQFLGDWLGSFRMPFFFFVSGLLFNRNGNISFKSFLLKKWKGLGRPFIIFSFVVFLGYCIVDTPQARLTLEQFPTSGWGGYALWFIPVLFATNTLYYCLCRVLKKDSYRLLALLILSCLGFFTYVKNVPNYWNLNFVLTAVLFYGVGNLLSTPLIKTFNTSSSIIVLAVSGCSALISLCFIFNEKPEFYVNHLGSGILTHLSGIAGAVMMCGVSVLLSRAEHQIVTYFKSTLKYFGKNSYVVLAFHQIIIIEFAFWLPKMPSVVCHIFMWAIVVAIIELLTRKIPCVLGR